MNNEKNLSFKKILYPSAFVFLICFFAGAFIACVMSDSSREEVFSSFSAFLSDKDRTFVDIFTASAGTVFVLFFSVFLCGFLMYGSLLALVPLSFKGLSTGLTMCLIVEMMEESSLKAILLYVLPQNLLLCPLLIIASALAVLHGFSGEKKHRQSDTGAYLCAFAVIAVLAVASCAIEGFFSQESL